MLMSCFSLILSQLLLDLRLVGCSATAVFWWTQEESWFCRFIFFFLYDWGYSFWFSMHIAFDPANYFFYTNQERELHAFLIHIWWTINIYSWFYSRVMLILLLSVIICPKGPEPSGYYMKHHIGSLCWWHGINWAY